MPKERKLSIVIEGEEAVAYLDGKALTGFILGILLGIIITLGIQLLTNIIF